MKRFLKSALSMLLAMCMILSLGAPAFAAESDPAEPAPQDEVLKIVFLDCGRKYFSPENIKRLIDNVKAGGGNTVQLAVGNDGLRLLLDDMAIGEYTSDQVKQAIIKGNNAYYNDPNGNYLTQAEMDDIIAYADSQQMQIIPLLESPGHMNALIVAMNELGITNPSYNGSITTMDLENPASVAFVKGLLTKYAQYFGSKGCKYMNMGADEYANDIGSMGINGLISSGKYPIYADYINSVNAIIKAAGMTAMAFNDGFYYGGNESVTFDNDVVICFWSTGWWGYNPVQASVLDSKGFKLVNTNGSFYWVLKGNPDRDKCTAEHAAEFDIHAFAGGSTIANPVGGMFCIWCDRPSEMTDTQVVDAVTPVAQAFCGAFDKKPLPPPPVPADQIQGTSASSDNLNTELNGENLNIGNMVDGNESTRANVSNTTDLMNKSLVLEYPEAVYGLKIVSGDGNTQYGGDKLAARTAVYLSTDGQNWGEKVTTITSKDIVDDGNPRIHVLRFENPNQATYVKLVFEENDRSGWSRIAEIWGLKATGEGPDIPDPIDPVDPAEPFPLVKNENLAPKGTASASTTEVSRFSADQAIDGKTDTRWSSTSVDNQNQWLQVDFGAPRKINTAEIVWEAACGKTYTIDVSDDGREWTTVGTVTNGTPSEVRAISFPDTDARYVRVHITERGGTWDGASIFEFRVFYLDWEFISQKAGEELDKLLIPSELHESLTLPTQSHYGAQMTWTCESENVQIVDGQLTVTAPQTSINTVLKVTVTFRDQQMVREYPVLVLSDEDYARTYSINPVPHKQTMTYKPVDLSTVKVYLESGISAVTKARLERALTAQGVSYTFTENYAESTLALGIKGSGLAVDLDTTGYAESLFTESECKYDAYYLNIDAPRTVLLGEDDDAVFFGIATLQLAMDQFGTDHLPGARFEDYASKDHRGVVEGYYGKVYTIADLDSLLDYMELYKMNTFVYGPKGDPYHLGYWRQDYPTTITDQERFMGQLTQDDIRHITAKCAANNIDFVWAIHPAMQSGIDFSSRAGTDQGVTDVLQKFDHMYSLGVRQFGVFVDDIDQNTAYRCRENHAYLIDQIQIKLEEKYNQSENPADHVGGTYFVPTFYGLDFGTPSSRDAYLSCLKNIHPNINITFTGAGCWASIENRAMSTMLELTGRKPTMWWNYPVNDNVDDKMFMLPINTHYYIDNDVVNNRGILSNPMNQAEASKVSLYSVADYNWNMEAFDAQSSWEKGIRSYSKDTAITDALRLFAIHVNKEVSPTEFIDLLNQYRADGTGEQEIKDQIGQIQAACQTLLDLEKSEDAKLAKLSQELKPWLLRLRDMCTVILDSFKLMETGDMAYLVSISDLYSHIDNDRAYYTESLEGQGTSQHVQNHLVQPSVRAIQPFMRYMYAQASQQGLGVDAEPKFLSNLGSEGLVLSYDGTTYTGTGTVTLNPGDYVMADLGRVLVLANSSELNGLEKQFSVDGKTWVTEPTDARYIRYINRSETAVEADLSQFTAQGASYGQEPNISVNMTLYQPSNYPKSNLVDGDNSTYVWVGEPQAAGQEFVVDYGGLRKITGIEIAFDPASDCLVGTADVSYKNADGQWVSLKTLDSTELVDGCMSLSGLDLQGTAIRFTIQSVDTHNWLKFCEFRAVSDGGRPQAIVNGSGNGSVCDTNPSTGISETGAGELIYHIFESIRPESLSILQNGDSWNGVSVYAVDGKGQEHLLTAGPSASNRVHNFDLTGVKDIRDIKLAWTDGIDVREIQVKGTQYLELNVTGVNAQLAAAAALDRTGKDEALLAELDAAVKAAQDRAVLIADREVVAQETVDADAQAIADALAKLNGGAAVKTNIFATNMTLGNELAMNLLVKKSDVRDLTGLAMQVTKTFADGRPDVVLTIPAENWKDYNKEYYAVVFDDISAKEMTDDVTAVILKDGVAAGDVYTDSVAAYALRLLRGEQATAELKTTVVDMLNYGTAAQKHFEYHLDALANAQLTAEEKALASASVTAENTCVKGTGYVGANLNLGSNMALTVFFRNITPEMQATVSYTKHTGEVKTLQISGADFVKFNDTLYGVRVNTLVVADAHQPVEITVYDVEGNVIASGTDSIESYVARANSLGELGDSIMKFSASAKAYFESLHK